MTISNEESLSHRKPDPDDRRYWKVTIGWTPVPGQLGGWAEAGGQVDLAHAASAEEAVARCREWRGVGPDVVLEAVYVVLVDPRLV